ncbi:hypothetical protein [Alkalihalobacillus sp. BA299]|uniref:IS1096 element passenger TnpR family protein n=1 Tax=Alkalihalobacillus sp. BA299 TaxID=2815938 RepID=UPI001AD95253|nr:hypothetical protein [Alkalihalobacillus sp. BA299]
MSGGAFASIVSKQVVAFRNLSSIEQYLVLLQCFWEKLDWSVFERRHRFRPPSNIDFLFESLEKYAANKKINVNTNEDLKQLLYQYDHFLLYFSYLGLWEVELNKEKDYAGTHFMAKTLKLTPLFKKIDKALAKNWLEHLEESNSRDAGLESFLSLIGINQSILKPKKRKKKEITPLVTLLKPIFPEANLDNPFLSNGKKFTSGVFTLKVTFGSSCSRTIQISSSHTLLDLHKLIQRSFGFQDDHLYSFYMDGKKFSKNCYNCLEEGVGPFVNEAQFGSLQLIEGQRFLYLFDFGDEWKFDIEVIRISEGTDIIEAKIVDQKGEAPLQYGDF